MGRHRKHASNAERQKEYRLRRKQLKMLLAIENPEPGSLPWRVQFVYYRKQFAEIGAKALREREAKG